MQFIFKKIICLLFLLVCACSSKNDDVIKTIPEIYNEAYKNFDKRNYKQAGDEFVKIADEYPYSNEVSNSLIFSAYSYYKDKDYAKTILTIDRFFRFYPGHKEAPYMIYLKGMAFYNQISDVRREQSMSLYALQQFKDLETRFKDSKYTENAKNKIKIIENYLAAKIMYNAKLDIVKQNWTSAISKLQEIVTVWKNTVLVEEALFRLTECYDALNLQEQKDGYAKILKLNFKDSEWTNKL